MLKRLFLILTVFLLPFCLKVYAYDEFDVEATLGGQDSSGNYRWVVTEDGNLVPGTDSQNTIGESAVRPLTIYTDAIDLQSGKVPYQDPDVDTLATGSTTISYDYGIFEKQHLLMRR